MRRIVRTSRFEQEVERLREDHPRLDEALEGADFILERRPELGSELTNGHSRLSLDTPTPGKSLTIFYRFDDDTVHLESVIEIEA